MKLCSKCLRRQRVSSTSAWCYICIRDSTKPKIKPKMVKCDECIAIKVKARNALYRLASGKKICGFHARKFKYSDDIMPLLEVEKLAVVTV